LIGDLPDPGQYPDGLNPPDPTAAIPLYDAFMEKGMVEMANRLLHCVFTFEIRQMPMAGDPAVAFTYHMLDLVMPFLFDLSSVCLNIAARLQYEPPKAEQSTVQLETLRFTVGHAVDVGSRATSPDGRFCLVVAILPNGMVEAIPITSGDEVPPMGYQHPMIPQQARRLFPPHGR
jgi:hypothetical protein